MKISNDSTPSAKSSIAGGYLMRVDETGANRQLKEFRAQQAFERNIARLRVEIRAGTPRRHLDVLVELLDALLPECGRSRLTDCYRKELHAARHQVSKRSHLRLVK